MGKIKLKISRDKMEFLEFRFNNRVGINRSNHDVRIGDKIQDVKNV